MLEKTRIELMQYNYGTNTKEPMGVTVSVYDLVRSISHDQFVYFLSEYLNCGMKDHREGQAVGRDFQTEHRTLQGSLYRFCIGAITSLSEQEYTDARNEVAVRNGKKIAEMVKNGEIELGWLI